MSVVLHFIKHAGKAFVVHLSCPALNVVCFDNAWCDVWCVEW